MCALHLGNVSKLGDEGVGGIGRVELSRKSLEYFSNVFVPRILLLEQGRVAGLLRPRPFLYKMINALVSRKFCERHSLRSNC
jgi:hypothetical protein